MNSDMTGRVMGNHPSREPNTLDVVFKSVRVWNEKGRSAGPPLRVSTSGLWASKRFLPLPQCPCHNETDLPVPHGFDFYQGNLEGSGQEEAPVKSSLLTIISHLDPTLLQRASASLFGRLDHPVCSICTNITIFYH